MIQKVTPDIAESLGLDEPTGALVADVVKDGPAEDAGIKQGDVIVEFDGKPVNDSAELPLLVARTPVGKHGARSRSCATRRPRRHGQDRRS